VLVTCLEGRNRKCAEAFIKTGKSFKQIEEEILNGQKLQGPLTAEEVNQVLESKNLLKDFPLFTSVYRICFQSENPAIMIQSLTVNHRGQH